MSASELLQRVDSILQATRKSKKDFAAAIGIDGPKLTKSLAGDRRFTSLELALIAQLGETSVDWLLTGAGQGLAARNYRAEPQAVQAGESVVAETLGLVADRLAGLRHLDRGLEVPELPPIIRGGGWLTEARKLAQAYRDRMGVDIGGRTNVELIGQAEETFGLDVIVRHLPEGLDGLSLVEGSMRAVVLATTQLPFRQRFTFAHELGHIAFNDSPDEVFEERMWTSRHPNEKRADSFAAYFLAPPEEIRRKLDGRAAEEIFPELVMHFHLSPRAMAWRLFNDGLIEAAARERFLGRTARSVALEAGRLDDQNRREQLASTDRPAMRLVNAYQEAFERGAVTSRPLAALLGEDLETFLSRDDDGGDFGPEH